MSNISSQAILYSFKAFFSFLIKKLFVYLKSETLVISKAEEKISYALEQLNLKDDSEKVKVLSKHHANLQLINIYSEIYHLIYGSQLELLQALKAQGSPVENEFLISFYEMAKQQYPDCYKSYSFESYINFLKSAGLVNTGNGRYFITNLGLGFLMHLAKSGINTNRAY